MSNPALSNNPAFSASALTADQLHRIYDRPDTKIADSDVKEASLKGSLTTSIGMNYEEPMTMEDSIAKTAALFATVVAFAVVGWMFLPGLALPAAIIGLVLGLTNSFRKEPNVPLIFAYAIVQGVFLGAISKTFEGLYPGVVSQAVLGTLSVFTVMLLLFMNGKVRSSPKMTKIFLVAMLGYLLFSVINLILMLTGTIDGAFGVRSVEVFGIPLGLIIGVFAVLLASYSLVMDFEFIQNGVRNKVPRRYGWSAAFGLMVTLIWLYVEILRILSIMRR